MRQRLRVLLSFAIFWILFQIVIRAVFLLYNHDLADQLTAFEVLRVFWSGLKMDLSMSGYFIMLTGLVLTISVFTQSRWLYLVLNALSITGIVLSAVISMVDLELYRHWGFRIDMTPLFYMKGTEQEALGSVDIAVAIKLLLILAALVAITLFIYSVWLMPKLAALRPTTKRRAVPLLVVTALMFLPIRGSFTVAPMNTGFVYFHKTKAFANHSAINVVWNFMYSMTKSAQFEYPENFFEKKTSLALFESLYPADDSTVSVFTIKQPNIVLFILESFTADVVEPLGGLKDVAPNLSALCNEGILFDNFYASGDRTDKGIVSILSGYPAQPQTSIIKSPAKSQKLPFLNHHMNDLGYTTSFIYGGDLDFANFRSYLTNCNFDYLTGEDDFEEDSDSKWGIHDHIVFDHALQECDTTQKPFFKVILSLSSHEPFDVPAKPVFEGVDEVTAFLNACRYTDEALGTFITRARQTSWWDSTVVVIVADHGHRFPGPKALNAKERFRIPFLMVGGAISKDSIVHTYGNQTDIANTLLGQLDRPVRNFRFSKNILSPNARSFSVYYYNNGYGFVGPGVYINYDNTGKQFLTKESVGEMDLDISKAYQQVLFSDYNTK